ADSQRIALLLCRIVEKSLETPPPPDTWSICLSYKLMPETEPPLPYIEQAVSCLNGYRDDAHLAAWKPGGLDAPALPSRPSGDLDPALARRSGLALFGLR
ncbi:MAG: hypothetical protein Q8N45_10895, partial [Anaerolineales bacterium]|nr:hypothetical protein [Anaerolineales bacterium]